MTKKAKEQIAPRKDVKIITNTAPQKGETTLNCNPNLVHVQIQVHSPDWFKFRTTGIDGVYNGGIGASEVSTFLDPYLS